MGEANLLNLIALSVVGLIAWGGMGTRTFISVVSLVVVGFAGVCAFAAVPVTASFISSNLVSDVGLARVLGFWAVFLAVGVAMWSLVDTLVPTPPRLMRGLDDVLGGLAGAATGALIASLVVLSLAIAPSFREAGWVAGPLARGGVVFGLERAAPRLLYRYVVPPEGESFDFLGFWTEGVKFSDALKPAVSGEPGGPGSSERPKLLEERRDVFERLAE